MKRASSAARAARLSFLRYLSLLSVFGSLWSASPAWALDSEYQSWAATFLQGRFGEGSPWHGWLDVHGRRGGAGTVVIVRPAVGYRFSPALIAHLGYGWIPTFLDSADDRHEHRIWQQANWVLRPRPSTLIAVRPRFEQRFVQGESGVGLRGRLFLRFNFRPRGESLLGLAVWDELFVPVNDTDWGQEAGIDQNRVFAGLAIYARPGMRVEAGYLNVFLNRSTDQLNHNLAVNLFFNLTPGR